VARQFGVARPAEQETKRERRVAEESQSHRRQQDLGERRPLGGDEQRHEHLGWEVLERVAVRQHDLPDSLRVVGQEELADGAAGVVADQRDVLEPEGVENLVDHPCHTGRREVSVGPHRAAMAAERPVDEVRADPGRGETVGDAVPEPTVDEEAVHDPVAVR
jgi:hypothetical protein